MRTWCRAPLLRWLRSDETAGTAVEYAIMASLIAAVCAVAVAALGATTRGLFERVQFP